MTMRRAVTCWLMLAAVGFLCAGCIGIHDNTGKFSPPPPAGMSEGDMLRSYGAPVFAGFAESEKIYVYNVRSNRYIILLGIYDGYDLVVTCENGEIKRVDRSKRPRTFSLFQPLPWAEAQ